MVRPVIPGYTYGLSSVAKSPLSQEDLDLLKKAVTLSEEDIGYLRMSADVLREQVEDIVNVWYEFIGSNEHLLSFFSRSDGMPDGDYLIGVRRRFERWIIDTAEANYDQDWLDYQYEIGLRHHRSKKNQTEGVRAAPNVSYRYLPALIYPITASLKPFLGKKGHNGADIEKMHQAWVKSVILQVALWSQAYVKDGDF